MKNDETKVEKMVGELAILMAKGFQDQEKILDKKIDDLAISVARGFSDQNERFEGRFTDLEGRFTGLEKRFDDQNERFEGRFDKLEKDNVWIKDMLEKQSGTLARLDQERIFTINHVNRLEKEIVKIKKHLKIA